jgi:hypothetical protein
MASEEIKRYPREIVERSGQLPEELQAVSIYWIYMLTAFFSVYRLTQIGYHGSQRFLPLCASSGQVIILVKMAFLCQSFG